MPKAAGYVDQGRLWETTHAHDVYCIQAGDGKAFLKASHA